MTTIDAEAINTFLDELKKVMHEKETSPVCKRNQIDNMIYAMRLWVGFQMEQPTYDR